MKHEIVASIIAETQEELEQRFDRVKEHVKTIQLDVMDHHFVKSKSLDFDFILPRNNCKIEAHLMIKHPDRWIKKYAEKVDIIIPHIETMRNPEKTIRMVKDKGKMVGFAINPETEIKEIEQYVDYLDLVLILTVHPGYYGSKFIPENLDKVKYLRKKYPDLKIEVDGGIDHDNIKQVRDAGADFSVIGSHIQKSHFVDKTMKHLYGLLE